MAFVTGSLFLILVFVAVPLKEFLHQQELIYIDHIIQSYGGNKDKAAEMLGISIATLYRKLGPGVEEQVCQN